MLTKQEREHLNELLDAFVMAMNEGEPANVAIAHANFDTANAKLKELRDYINQELS